MDNLDLTTKKLLRAINAHGGRILFNNSQFFSREKGCPINLYIIKQAVEKENGKFLNIELFKTASKLQVVLFLRDYWYKMNDKPLPQDNPKWNEIRERMTKNG